MLVFGGALEVVFRPTEGAVSYHGGEGGVGKEESEVRILHKGGHADAGDVRRVLNEDRVD